MEVKQSKRDKAFGSRNSKRLRLSQMYASTRAVHVLFLLASLGGCSLLASQ